MSFATNMQRVADGLINKYGNSIILIRKYNCSYDPALGENVCDEDIFNIKATIEAYSVAEISENVMINDLKVTIQEDMVIDTYEWKVTYLSQDWKIINIVTTTTQDKIVIQQLQIRT